MSDTVTITIPVSSLEDLIKQRLSDGIAYFNDTGREEFFDLVRALFRAQDQDSSKPSNPFSQGYTCGYWHPDRKINIIKAIRILSGMSLREAKQFTEAIGQNGALVPIPDRWAQVLHLAGAEIKGYSHG